MTVYLQGKKVAELPDEAAKTEDLICFAQPAEAPDILARLAIRTEGGTFLSENNRVSRFESHWGYDYIALFVPHLNALEKPLQPVELYFTAGQLLVVCQPDFAAVRTLRQDLDAWQGKAPTAAFVLSLLFSRLFAGDSAYLEDFEEEITALEEKVVSSKYPDDCTAEVAGMRRRLLLLKRYYEGLFDLLQDLEENQNDFFTNTQLRYFHMHTNRADRFSHTVGNLRDYVTQVREAYQNQLDINLNETMRFFTVITTICLPLTLIAGWFGMNLRMPEYESPYAYPIIIVFSIAVVVGLVWYFRRHKWF